MSGCWFPTGPMHEAWSNHSALLLPDGRVVVVGGGSRAAEVWDPSSNGWSLLGERLPYRINHEAVLLRDGRLLVLGGTGNQTTYASAQLLDPESGDGSQARPMPRRRSHFAAVRLGDGRVLVAGGLSHADEDLASAEVYDPERDTWAEVGPLNTARHFHRMVALPSGGALAVCGAASRYVLGGFEHWDGMTGKWSEAGRIEPGRFSHEVTLLADGRALVTGGEEEFPDEPFADTGVTALAWAWNATGRDAHVASMNQPRQGHRAARLPDGRVFVVGGVNPAGEGLSSAEVYDPVQNTWTEVASMELSRFHHTATALPDGRVLVVGQNQYTRETHAELWAPEGSGL